LLAHVEEPHPHGTWPHHQSHELQRQSARRLKADDEMVQTR
jgi:hypothetical protein